ncbi:MAG: hypothetical protein LBI38_00700 [Oscillospiraceae bacterium]|jgi:outer membrane lipoprotein-sorting protein|nr:hypothetical protein [Oscillospiraceae bacterium]
MKFIKFRVTAVAVAFLASCATGEFSEALKEFSAARKKYEELESARVVITDSLTGAVTENFCFRYEGDTLTYLYRATDGETVYAEYNNGSRLCYGYEGDADWTEVTVSDSDFYSYTKAIKHRYTKKTLFFLDEPSVSNVVYRDADGTVVEYSAEKLNKRSDKEKFSRLTAEFWLDGFGYIRKFERVHALEGGEEYAYLIEVTDMNAVDVIERPDFTEALRFR